MTKLYGSLEAGGTKFVCAVGDETFNVIDKIQFPTTTPNETIQKTIEFFKKYKNDLLGISVGSFGPIDIDENSETYGYITSTPKANWANTNLLGELSKEFNIPFYFTTDVNSSAFGESIARENVNSLVYYTIGTGIGAGAIQNGQFVGGLGHTEAGHTYVSLHSLDLEREFKGVCPFHGYCLEGMASGPSLEARTGIKGELIEVDSDIWEIQAYYVAQAVVQATLLYRPQVIVLGGGVMNQEHMLDRVRKNFDKLINGYLPVPDLKEYIVTPIVKENGSATLGNFALAKKVSEINL